MSIPAASTPRALVCGASTLALLLTLLALRPALAEPPITPARIVFSAAEYAAYEDTRQRRNNALIAIGGTTLIGTLLATGVTLLAFGLSDSGNAVLTTSGVTTLCVAALGTFAALDLYKW